MIGYRITFRAKPSVVGPKIEDSRIMISPSGPGKKAVQPELNIAHRIKTLRHAAGLSASALDHLAGLPKGTTGRLERGDQRIYANHLYLISSATGVDIRWFYDPAERNCAPASTKAQEQHQLLKAFMRIKDPALKRDVFELVETLAKKI